jgi:hypothetical protein
VLSEPDGSVIAYTHHGFYYRDKRYISNYEFYADGEHWILQNSGAIAYYASRFHLFNPRIRTEYGEIERSRVSLVFTRAVSDGVAEEFEIRNYGMQRVRFNFEIALRTDFADIFEVKAKHWLPELTLHHLRVGNSTPRYGSGARTALADSRFSRLTANCTCDMVRHRMIPRIAVLAGCRAAGLIFEP